MRKLRLRVTSPLHTGVTTWQTGLPSMAEAIASNASNHQFRLLPQLYLGFQKLFLSIFLGK